MSEYQSWGRYPHADQKGIMLDTRYDLVPELSSWLPYGNGRSYGDSCLNHNGGINLLRQLKYLSPHPVNYSLLYTNPLHGLRKGIRIYRSCYPITTDRGNRTICYKNSLITIFSDLVFCFSFSLTCPQNFSN